MLERQSKKVGMKTAAAMVGVALWYLLAGMQDLTVRAGLREENILQRAEDYLLLSAGLLSLLATVLLLIVAVLSWRSVLATAALVGFAVVFLEIGAVTISPQQEMAAHLSWGLRAALGIHVLLAFALYARCLIPGTTQQEHCSSGTA